MIGIQGGALSSSRGPKRRQKGRSVGAFWRLVFCGWIAGCGATETEGRRVSEAEIVPAESGETAAEESGSGETTEPVVEEGAAENDEVPAAEELEQPPLPEDVVALLATDAPRSRSIGGPNDGRVENAVAMPMEGPGFRFNPRRPPEARFGTGRMVRALVRAAMNVHEEVGGQATFNDLGLREGGPIPHHGSHRAGRDVDVLFYLLDAEENPHESVGAFLDPQGVGVDFRDLRDPDDDIVLHIDLPRTWRFVEALIQSSAEEGIPLARIFLVEHIRTMLLDYARANGGDEEAMARFAMLTCQPSAPHDDHFHFRFFCAPEDIGQRCTDTRPHYPWRVDELAAEGVEIVTHWPRPDRPMAPITTPAQARRAAGPMDPEVRRWLRMRRAWQRRPHPGREWCR